MGDLADVRLRGALAKKRASPEQEGERRAALQDLAFANCFRPADAPAPATGEKPDKPDKPDKSAGPFLLEITAEREYLRLSLIPYSADGADTPPARVHARLALMALKRILRDYAILCANHFEALQSATAQQTESLDMARRALHNEAAVMLVELLAPKIRLDEEAARKLFTLLFVLISAPAPGIALLYAAPPVARRTIGDAGLANANTGEANLGDANTDAPKTSETNTSETNTGETKTGETKTGETKTSETKTGETKTGEAKTGETKTGEAKTGDTKTGDVNTSAKPQAQTGQETQEPRATSLSRVVVFICNSNAIRSPIAAGLARDILPDDVQVLSAAAGDAREEPDGFVIRVMSERGHDVTNWKPLGLDELLPSIETHATQGTAMTIIALSKAAEPTVTDLARRLRVQAQKWRIADPSLVEFGQQARLEATREIATTIGEKIKNLLAPSLLGALVADDVVTARANSASDKNALHSGTRQPVGTADGLDESASGEAP